jgi:hypothetical protein
MRNIDEAFMRAYHRYGDDSPIHVYFSTNDQLECDTLAEYIEFRKQQYNVKVGDYYSNGVEYTFTLK